MPVGKMWESIFQSAGSWRPQRDLNSRRRRERPENGLVSYVFKRVTAFLRT